MMAMMGTKVRSFTPLPRDVSLENLVPKDHFYRRLEQLRSIRRHRTAPAGRFSTGWHLPCTRVDNVG